MFKNILSFDKMTVKLPSKFYQQKSVPIQQETVSRLHLPVCLLFTGHFTIKLCRVNIAPWT